MGFLKGLVRNAKQVDASITETRSEDIITPEKSDLDVKKRSGISERPSLKIEEINSLKKDLSRTAEALRESMRLNNNSIAEIEKLSSFMQSAEKNALKLERLQPENADIKIKLEALQSELSKKTLWAGELESKSMAYKARFEEAHKELEACNTKILSLQEKLNDSNSAQIEHADALDRLKAEREDLLEMINDLRDRNTTLQTQFKTLSESEKVLARQNTELQKQTDQLGAQIEDERRSKERSMSELKGLRLDYAELKSEQMETLSKMDKALHDVDSTHQVLSEQRQRNEDKIFALTATIDGLKAQQKINEDMARYDGLEKEKLRNEMQSQRNRADDLDTRLAKRTEEMHDSRIALGRAKENYDALNQKFLAMISEIETLRRDHKAQARKLDEYSSISGVAVGQSFYDESKRGNRGQAKASGESRAALKLVKDGKL